MIFSCVGWRLAEFHALVEEFTRLLFGESSVFGNVKSKITTCQQVHDEVEICSILKRVHHID